MTVEERLFSFIQKTALMQTLFRAIGSQRDDPELSAAAAGELEDICSQMNNELVELKAALSADTLNQPLA
jgi:hypothetical protein